MQELQLAEEEADLQMEEVVVRGVLVLAVPVHKVKLKSHLPVLQTPELYPVPKLFALAIQQHLVLLF